MVEHCRFSFKNCAPLFFYKKEKIILRIFDLSLHLTYCYLYLFGMYRTTCGVKKEMIEYGF